MKLCAPLWFGYMMRMNEDEFVKRTYECMIESRGVKGKWMKWINKGGGASIGESL